MPKFTYTVKDRNGKAYRNTTDAASQASLVEKLQSQGYFIINIKELTVASRTNKKVPFKKKKKHHFSHKDIKLDDLLAFSRQLATMLSSGVTLIRGLDVIQSQVHSAELFKVIKNVKDNVEQGSPLSMALAKYPKVFNQFWVSLIEVGEASGTIPLVLNKLAFYLEQQARFRSTIISGLIYPAILFCVATGAIIFFAVFVGPRFEAIFTSMDAQLPGITVVLLGLFKYIKTNIIKIVLVIGGFIFILSKYFKTYGGRLQLEGFMFNLPVFGEIYRLIVVERFASQMAILIDAGVPILYALDITERLVDNNTCALIVNDIKSGVRQGELLVTPMERSGFFPPMAIQMILVGEETGELGKMLKHISGFYQEHVETFMKRFSTIIEPFMLVFMGAVIGTIVLAMFMPMFNLAQMGGG